MKRELFVVLLALVIGFFISAQTISIDYVQGKVEVLIGSKWTKLSEGSSIQTSSSVKLSEGSMVEFGYNGSKISLVDPGTYELRSVISSSREVKSWDLLSVIGGKISKTFGTSDEATGNAALGVRGAEEKDEGVGWAYDDSDAEQLELAKTYIDEKKYNEAIKLLKEYLGSGTGTEVKRARYYLAYAHAMIGETGMALQQVNKSGIGPEDTLFQDYVLLKGKLLMDSLSYRKALGLFNDYIKAYPEGSVTQTVLILRSYCYKGIGDSAKQKESLENAQNLDPRSPEGVQARKLLDSLSI
jgi:hypothetical protein